jgi:hypothetical protein
VPPPPRTAALAHHRRNATLVLHSRLMSLGSAIRGITRHPMRAYCWPIAAGVVLAGSAFMPWISVGTQQFGGVPDMAGLWVLVCAILTIVLAGLSITTRKNSRHPLLLVGLCAFGILFLAEQLMQRSAAQQGWSTAQARAIVQGGPARATAEPNVAPGAYVGLGAATAISLFGLTVVFKRGPRLHAAPAPTDDDV